MLGEGGKSHRKKKAGKKAEKKKNSAARKGNGGGKEAAEAAKRNPKAFIFSSRGKAKIQVARSADKDQKRMHVPLVEKEVEEPPPFTVLVHGPPGVGKTTLIRCLIKHYIKQDVKEIKGPITLVTGKSRRLTFIECPQDMTAMIDAAKYADLVLLLIDGDFGFEMETFEFLNMLQVHGFPKVMGVLTHLDTFKDSKALKKTKKVLKHRFWSEIYQGAKLFYLSGIKNGRYLNREVLNLARFISVMKFRPLSWRQNHPYLLVDRFEDTTSPEAVRKDPKCDRDVAVYGYLRGSNWKYGTTAHIAGAGDYRPIDIDAMPDPCPLPSQIKKRGLNEKERRIYAPMSDIGGLLYDKDAMYVEIPDWKVQYSAAMAEREGEREGEALVRHLQKTRMSVDEKLQNSKIQLFAGENNLLTHESFMADGNQMESEELESDDSGSEDIAPEHENLPSEELVQHGDRLRRRAIFDENEYNKDELLENDTDSEDEDEISDEYVQGLDGAVKWKAKMQENISALFSSRSIDLQNQIYGDPDKSLRKSQDAQPLDQTLDSDSDDDLFRLKSTASASQPGPNSMLGRENIASNFQDIDEVDATKIPKAVGFEASMDAKWSSDGATEDIRNRFVTGDWEVGQARNEARPDDEDDEIYGDFEDIETGEAFKGSDDPATQAAVRAISATEKEDMLSAKKAAKKAAFDAAYDEGGSLGPDKSVKSRSNATAEDDEDETYYDAMKREISERALKTKQAMDALDPAQRIKMEGFRPGTYIRIRFSGMRYELVKNFDPRLPMLVGGLGKSEEAQGYMQIRLKRHRWFPKILKNKDPLIFSVGWRRFQSLPIYAIKDNNERHRMLKYSPEHMHCLAAIWGPLAPPGSGVLAVQKMSSGIKHWRISATGVVLQLDATLGIVKKLKLVGTPFKIHRHTAFINGMFNSQLEAAKFEGASIRTVSGIRGTIKKALRVGSMPGAREGSFRATFEDKPLLSDIVFLRAWVKVDIPKFCNPVTDLLGPREKAAIRAEKQRRTAIDSENAVAGNIYNIDEVLSQSDFDPAHKFLGSRDGYIFTKGPKGLGYYMDNSASDLAPVEDKSEQKVSIETDVQPEEEKGWFPMRTVADIRRDTGVGAPRQNDSLYREIERKPRVFNPLKIPSSLQAALPYKSKPKIELARKKKSLEQRRAIIVEPQERKKISLVAQLNAIRNVKAVARRDQRKRHQEKMAKKLEEEEAWRQKYNKEERKKRYIEQGQAEKKRQKKFK